MAVVASLLLAGCEHHTPYLAAQHVDATPVDGGSDAWDAACAGWKGRKGRLEAKAAWCENLRGGEMIQAGIEFDLIGE